MLKTLRCIFALICIGCTTAAHINAEVDSASNSKCEKEIQESDTEWEASCSGPDAGAEAGNCLFDVSPGNYDVQLALSGEDVRITAESRRLFARDMDVPEGGCIDFTVNVREPEGQPLEDVDPGIDGLNFVFTGDDFRLNGIHVTSADHPTMLYLIGDSTVCDKEPAPELPPANRRTGWGQILPRFFKRGLSVANLADSGETTETYRVDEGPLWHLVGDPIQAGDFLFIQLGHNEKETAAETYRTDIENMIIAARDAGAAPVLVTPMVRNNGVPLAEQHLYGDLNIRAELLAISTAMEVPLIDLMSMSDRWIAGLGGKENAAPYFVEDDYTHANEEGAEVFAEMMVQGIREQVPSLDRFLR